MDEECPKEYSESGPVVDVCVIDPNPSGASKRSSAKPPGKGGGDCEVKVVSFCSGNGISIPPIISIVSFCEKACKDNDCRKYKLNVVAAISDKSRLIVARKIRYRKDGGTDICSRDPKRVEETKEHEQRHCEGYMAGVAAVIAFVDGHGLNNNIYDSCDECQEKAREIIKEAKEKREALLKAEMNHESFRGEPRACVYPDDALDGETACDTEKRKCGVYDPDDTKDQGYSPPKWEKINQQPCD